MDLNKLNKYQTPITDELKKKYHKEIWNELLEYLSTVKFLQNLIAPEEIRGFAKDRPKETKFYDDGRIDVDITKPHILEDLDFFRERAIFFENNGKYTNLIPNSNPKSEYANFWKEELHRWKYGMVRPSDGEWIPGYLYFYWNYSPIWLVVNKKGSKQGDRVRKFPKPWLGDYIFFHYLDQARCHGKHGKNLKARGIGMSFKNAAMSPRNMYVYPGAGNVNFHLANEKSYLQGDKGLYGKVLEVLDHIADTTPLPRMRLIDGKKEMVVQLGYTDEYGGRKGLLSSTHAISLKDNPDKARGARGVFCHYEEDGIFDNLEKAWNVNRPGFEDGGIAVGLMLAAGTGGVEGASFEGSQKLFYNHDSYNIYGIPNVFDKNTDGSTTCGHFWGAYLNRHECYDLETGEPDIIKSLLEILTERFTVKYGSSDPNAITQKKAELPITPQEAIMRTEGTVFPIADIKSYLETIAPKKEAFLAEHLVGDLIVNSDGQVEWKPNSDISPLRSFESSDTNRTGAVEIFEMPKKNAEGVIPRGRYIAGIDPIDSDAGASLFSVIVMDLFTDRIVAEYTGRPKLASDAYETTLRLLKFYNAEGNYESNLKGLFSYFDNKNALYYLADVPQILKDMEMVKATNLFGNKAHPYSEKVYTPNGVKFWGDIQIGDELFSTDGNTTKVIDIPFDNDSDIYEITLKDGRRVKASSNHLWNVVDWSGYEKILSTFEIKENYYRYKGKYKEFKYYIPKNEGVEYENKKVSIDPYTLGLLLGDGSFSLVRGNVITFTSNLKDIETYKKESPYEFTKPSDNRHMYIKIPNIGKYSEKLNLKGVKSRTKFIPNIYKYNSKEVRLNILKGLLDTDGCVGYGGNPEYCTTSKLLAYDVIEISRSLGINCNLNITTNTFGKVYKVRFYSEIPLFKLKRKYSKQKITKTRAYKTAIVNIKYLGREKSKCVTVDSKDSCYLIADYITTHNSKGTHANKQINSWGRQLQAEYMLTDAHGHTEEDEDGNIISTKLNLHTIRSIPYLEECIAWNSDGNFDRVSAAGMLFILREDRRKRTETARKNKDGNPSHLSNDPFFKKNFKQKRYGSFL